MRAAHVDQHSRKPMPGFWNRFYSSLSCVSFGSTGVMAASESQLFSSRDSLGLWHSEMCEGFVSKTNCLASNPVENHLLVNK